MRGGGGAAERRVDTELGESQSRDFGAPRTWGFVCKVVVLCGQFKPCPLTSGRCAESDGPLQGTCVYGFLLAKITIGVCRLCLTLGLSVLTNMICCL